LKASWDPSIHVTEAVRPLSDIERAQNLLGERLGSWAARDAPELDPGDARRAAARLLDEPIQGAALDQPEPALEESRRALARAYRSLGDTRAELEKALQNTGAARTPNLTKLLGPDLAARLVAQAGGLERLSRLPASTIQVLGAERAFFEHLRGRAPPPRHGLLFLHPKIQSANRTARGRLSRALAGKAAIAARLDRAHAPLDERLSEQFEARALAIGQSPPRRGGRRGSRLPLDRAASDR
jgi:nucleolar protein 56